MTTIQEISEEPVQKDSFTINRLAVSMLDLNKSESRLSNRCDSLDRVKHKIFYDFFEEHIDDTRKGKRTRECKFFDSDNSIITKISRYTENISDDSFLDLTNELTKTLFKIMKTATKSSGSLFILDINYYEENYIVILKLDLMDGVQLDRKTLDLNKIEDMLPQSGDKVHKCALIKSEYIENQVNLFVLDKQQSGKETTHFFMNTFLSSTPLPDDNMKTLDTLDLVYDFLGEKYPDKDDLEKYVEPYFNNGTTVHIPDIIENILNKILPPDEPDRDIIINNRKDNFVSIFQEKHTNYSLTLEVDRNDEKTFFVSNKNKIYMRYNSELENKEVTVDEKSKPGKFIIIIDNTEEINFRKDRR